MAEAYDVYVEYLAIKKAYNFPEKYDYVKYNGKVNASKAAFSARKDRKHYYKLLTMFDWNLDLVRYYLLVKMLYYPNNWIGKLFPEGNIKSYDATTGTLHYIEQLVYQYYSEIHPMLVFQNELNYSFDDTNVREHTLQDIHSALDDTFSRNTYLLEDVYLFRVSPMFMYIIGDKLSNEIAQHWEYATEKTNPFMNSFTNRLLISFSIFNYLGLFQGLTKKEITDTIRKNITRS